MITLMPNINRTHTHINLGEVLLMKGRLDEAIAEYREALRSKMPLPEAYAAHAHLCWALEQKRQWDEAIAEYRESIRLMPNFALAHNNLAYILATCPDSKLRNYPQAVELAKKAVLLEPKKGDFWNTLGEALYYSGSRQEALAALEKSMQLRKGGDSFDWFFLAMIYQQQGEKEKARQWYDKAVQWMDKNQPNNEELRRFRREAAEVLGVKTKSD
jgi:tetratricopeptide (TPR) repeat protein